MQALHQKAKDLLESGRVKVIIGYGEGSGEKVRPVFIRHSADVSQLVWDQRCRQNLAVYLSKPEIKKMGMPEVQYVITRVNRPENQWLFTAHRGVDTAFCPVTMMADFIKTEIDKQTAKTHN